MRFITTRVHGYLDYLVGLFLIFMPWAFGFARDGAETWVPVLLGLGAILYSVFTNYGLGLIHAIPMRTHLTLDYVEGIILASSPWLFGFANWVWVPHLCFGLFEVGAALCTKTRAYAPRQA